MNNPIIDAAEGRDPDAVLFEENKQYRKEYLASLLESYRMAMGAIARLGERVNKQDEAIANLKNKQDEAIANLKAEINRSKPLVDDIALPKGEFFVWHSTPRGRMYELIECRGVGTANAYGQSKYGLDFIATTQPVNFQAWHLGELGLDSEPVSANSLEEAEAIAQAAYGDSLVEVRAIQCQSKD